MRLSRVEIQSSHCIACITFRLVTIVASGGRGMAEFVSASEGRGGVVEFVSGNSC